MGQSCERDRRYSRLIEKHFGQKLSKKTADAPIYSISLKMADSGQA